MAEAGSPRQPVSRRLAQVFGVLACTIALLAAAGWTSGWLLIAQLGPRYVPMAPSTALAIAVLGAGLFAQARWHDSLGAQRLAACAAAVACGWVVLIFASHVGDFRVQWESYLAGASESIDGIPTGRMSPITAIAVILAGLALLALATRAAAWRVGANLSAALATCVTAISSAVLLTYAYKTPRLFGESIPVALPTAVALLLVALGLLAAGDRRAWPTRNVVGPSVRARLLRAFLPITLAIALCGDWVQSAFQPQYIANPALWSSAAALATLTIFAGVVMLVARGIGSAIERAETSLQESESRYRSLFHGSPCPLWEEDCSEVKRHLDALRAAGVADFREYFGNHMEAVRECVAKVNVLDVNQAVLDLHQAVSKPELLAGLPIIFTDETYDAFRGLLIAAADGKTTYDVEGPVRTLQGEDRHVLFRWTVAPGSEQTLAKVYVSQTDITGRKAHEREIERLNRLYSALSELHQTVVRVTSPEELFREVCRITAVRAGFRVAWIGRPDPKTHLVNLVASAGGDRSYLDGICVYADDRAEGRGPVGTCIRENKTVIINDFLSDSRTVPWRAAATAYGLRAAIALPIRFHGEVYTALTVYNREANVFQENEIALLEEAAAATSLALERLNDEARRQRADEALRQSEERYRSLFDNMLGGFAYCQMLFDDQGRPADFVYLAVNNAFERLTGLKDVVGKRVTAVIPGIKELSPELFEVYGRVALGGKPEEFEFDFKSMNLWLSIAVYSIEKGTFVAVFEDITARKRAELAIRASEAKYRRLHETMRDAFVSVTMDGRIQECNRAFAEMLGYTGEEIRALTYLDLTPQKWHAIEAEIVATQVMVRGFSDVYEKEYRKKDGTVFPVELRSVLLKDEVGEPCGMWGVVRDISERKRADEALRHANAYNRTLFEASLDLLATVDPNGIVTDVNRATEEATGYPREYLIGTDCAAYFTEPERAREGIRQVFREGDVRDFALELKHRDGSARSVLYSACTYQDGSGKVIGVLAAARDITERKRAEIALHESEEIYRTLVENVGIGITLIDSKHTIVTTNTAQAGMFGKPADGFRGKKCFREFEKRDAVCPHCPGTKAMATGQPAEVETVGVKDDGRRFDARVRAFPLYSSDGAPKGFIELVEDITGLKESQESLRQAKEAAEAANRAKSAFLANMSHEIRTPMAAILGHAELMLEENVGRATQEHVAVIKRNGEHLMNVIGDILDLSKIEAERLQINRVPCSPVQMLAEVASLMRPQAAAKQLKLTTELIGPLPESMCTDPVRLRQVLVNLLSNAIKFTDRGEVVLRVEIEGLGSREGSGMRDEGSEEKRQSAADDASRLVPHPSFLIPHPSSPVRLKFTVSDTGIGMDAQQIGALFQPFSQVDDSSTRKFGGTGLGLCISKRLAEALGGKIEVRSEPGKGSSFSVTIDPGPLDAAHMIQNAQEARLDRRPTSAAPTPAKIALHGRILLAEDGPDNRRLLCLLLKKAGAEVTAVENGQRAVEAALAARAAGKPFHVILMDMQMPVMDGYTAAEELRKQGYTAPIVALTAHAMEQDCRKCLAAGCDDYASKPIDRQKLLTTVAPWLSCGRAEEKSLNPAVADLLPGPAVLSGDGLSEDGEESAAR